MRLLIVCAGARAAGKSYTAARLAEQMPGALVLEEHAHGLGDDDHRYSPVQHIQFDWDGPLAEVRDRIKFAQVVILCATVAVAEKVQWIQTFGPCAVIYAGSMPRTAPDVAGIFETAAAARAIK